MEDNALLNSEQRQELDALQVKSYFELAHLQVKDFMRTIYKLIMEENKTFDLLVGAGNSGIIMVGLAKVVYEYSGLTPPPVLLIPFKRYKVGNEGNLFDHTLFQSYVTKEVAQILQKSKISEILFVDDETMKGITVNESLKLILAAMATPATYEEVNCTLVTEDRTTAERLSDVINVAGIRMTLCSFPSKTTRHAWCIIKEHFRPPVLEEVEQVLAKIDLLFPAREYSTNFALNVGLNLPIKRNRPGSKPCLDYNIIEEVRRSLPQLEIIQRNLSAYLGELCRDAIKGSKTSTR